MPTPDWRMEKSAAIITSICHKLSDEDVAPETRDALAGDILWNALKLYADALEEGLESGRTKWSPGVVALFRDYPGRCDEWLTLMAEDEFSAEAYWNDLGRKK